MTAKIRLAPDLSVPTSIVTEPVGIFANRGKGKSNAAHLLVEQLYHAGLPTIVLDVKGDWYGIRSSADGRKAGLPFLVLGGEHGDVPLEEGSGRMIAQLLAEQRVPTIVDLSAMSKTKARRWVMEFAEALYRANREPLMLIVDEADVLIPQRLAADLMRLLGAMEDIAKRGRQRGLGMTVISQRVADVNKSVTDLLETLFLFAVTGTRTRKAVLDWIDDHGDTAAAKDVVATLSTLEPGECWVWSPGTLKILQRTRLDRISTFDSHATPEPGKTRAMPRTLADVDLAAIKEAMTETLERAAADDPRALHKRIATLERELATADARLEEARATPAEVERIEVSVLTDADRELVKAFVGRWDDAYDRATEIVNTLNDALRRVDSLPPIEKVASARVGADQRGSSAPRSRHTPPSARSALGATAEKGRSEGRETRPVPPAGSLTTPQGRILDALAWLAAVGVDPASRVQVAMIAGYHPRTKGFTNALGSLSSGGLVQYPQPGMVALTTAGYTLASAPTTPPTSGQLQGMIYAQVGQARSRILRELVTVYPDPLTRTELADRLDYHERTKGFTNALGALRTLGLLEYPAPGLVAATDLLFVRRGA